MFMIQATLAKYTIRFSCKCLLMHTVYKQMLIDVNLMKSYAQLLGVRGIFHIGANTCQELGLYTNEFKIPAEKIVWIEAIPEIVQQMKVRGIPNIYQAVLDEKPGEVEFNVTSNNGESSSILPLHTHETHYPSIKVQTKLKLPTQTFHQFVTSHSLPEGCLDFLVMDIQGAELQVLRGSPEVLANVKMICTEVNNEELYKGAGLFKELHEFLTTHGFECVKAVFTDKNWGDAFYVRREAPIVFVCHDQMSVDVCLQKHPKAYIMLVGPAEITVRDPARTIIVRDLPHNIEQERKLLTFTAWYAIIKNNLFPHDSHLCILEWDVSLNNTSFGRSSADIVSFLVDNGLCFCNDINVNVLQSYLEHKGLTYSELQRPWVSTTNHCIRRSILAEFVDWYYPSCMEILAQQDRSKLSWYHERLFWIFIQSKQYSIHIANSITHIQAGSHQNSFNSA